MAYKRIICAFFDSLYVLIRIHFIVQIYDPLVSAAFFAARIIWSGREQIAIAKTKLEIRF